MMVVASGGQCSSTSTTPWAKEPGMQLSSELYQSHGKKHYIRVILILQLIGKDDIYKYSIEQDLRKVFHF